MEKTSDITMYSTENLCGKCGVLKQKLEQKGIEFRIVADARKVRELGFLSVPVLWNNKEYLDFKEAVKWINNIQKDN